MKSIKLNSTIYDKFDHIVLLLYIVGNLTLVGFGLNLLIRLLPLMGHLLIDLNLIGYIVVNHVIAAICTSIGMLIIASLGVISVVTYSYPGIFCNLLCQIALLLTMVIFLVTADHDLSHDIHETLVKEMKLNGIGSRFIHLIQQSFSCCGIDSFNEWILEYGIIPGSCCDSPNICKINDPKLQYRNCFSQINAMVQSYVDTLKWTIIASSIAMIFMIQFSYIVGRFIRRTDDNTLFTKNILRLFKRASAPTENDNTTMQRSNVRNLPKLSISRTSNILRI